jgi:hypothetical protein
MNRPGGAGDLSLVAGEAAQLDSAAGIPSTSCSARFGPEFTRELKKN